MKRQVRLTGGCLAIAAAALLSSPASSLGAVECKLTGSDRVLEVTASDSSTTIRRSGESLVVSTSTGTVDCTGAPATVANTDLVRITHSGRTGDVLALAGGPFAPGLSLEPSGASEIEFEYVGPTHLSLNGTPGADRLTWGPGGGVNLNGDDDVDVTGPFTTNIVQGLGGNDLIAPQGDFSPGGAELIASGGKGNDRITTPPSGGVVHGGGGADRLSGGPRTDNITGGRGNDLIRAGKGRDLIRSIDGTRDRVFCGGGIDKVKPDGIDELKGCELRIRVKKKKPARR